LLYIDLQIASRRHGAPEVNRRSTGSQVHV